MNAIVKKTEIFLLLTLLCLANCVVRDNPFDSKGDNYVQPSLTVENTNIPDHGVLESDSLYIVIAGNTEKNEFRYSIDNRFWSPWNTITTINEKYFDDGGHMIYMQTRYPGGVDTISDSLDFSVYVLPPTAVYFYARKQYVTGGTAKFNIRTKGVPPVYVMHIVIGGATIVKDSITYTDNENVNSFCSNTTIDLSVMPGGKPIINDCNVVDLVLKDINSTNVISIDTCVLTNSDSTIINVDIVRGGYVVKD